jgi:hypothetical protein
MYLIYAGRGVKNGPKRRSPGRRRHLDQPVEHKLWADAPTTGKPAKNWVSGQIFRYIFRRILPIIRRQRGQAAVPLVQLTTEPGGLRLRRQQLQVAKLSNSRSIISALRCEL